MSDTTVTITGADLPNLPVGSVIICDYAPHLLADVFGELRWVQLDPKGNITSEQRAEDFNKARAQLIYITLVESDGDRVATFRRAAMLAALAGLRARGIVTHPIVKLFNAMDEDAQDAYMLTWYHVGAEPDFSDPTVKHGADPRGMSRGEIAFCTCNWHPFRHGGALLSDHLADMKAVGNLVVN